MGRRDVLTAGMVGLLGAGLVTGCSADASRTAPTASTAAPTAPPTADDRAAARARAAASALAAAAEILASSRRDLAALLASVIADHRAHLAALGAPSPSGVPSPSPPATPLALPRLIEQEWSAAQEALDDVGSVSPGLAALLARVAASRAVHADLLAPRAGVRVPGVLRTSPRERAGVDGTAPGTPAPLRVTVPPTPLAGAAADGQPPQPVLSQDARDALAALTAGEQVAVFAYGAVVARVDQPDRDRAREAWTWHMARRDALEERLLAAGMQPPAAAPAYDLGPLASARAAATLAATVEDRIAALTARAVARTSAADRFGAAEALVAGARRAAAWRGHGEALPG